MKHSSASLCRVALPVCPLLLVGLAGPHAQAAPAALAPPPIAGTRATVGTSVNADIARAIQEVTGRAPSPAEENAARYGFSYDEVKARVAKVYLPCDNAQVSRAVLAVTGRPARGLDDQGECNIALYGDGKWSSYDDLTAKVKQVLITKPYAVGVCRVPDVTRAITDVKHARGVANTKPSGAGELGECNSDLYGGGQWSSFTDLKTKVAARLDTLKVAGIQLHPDNSVTPIASRGGSSKWMGAAGAMLGALAQWKADQSTAKQQQKMQRMMAMQGQGGMPQQGMMPGQNGMQNGMMPQNGMQPGMMPQGGMMPGQNGMQPGMMQGQGGMMPQNGMGMMPGQGAMPMQQNGFGQAMMGGLQPNMMPQGMMMPQPQMQQGMMQQGMMQPMQQGMMSQPGMAQPGMAQPGMAQPMQPSMMQPGTPMPQVMVPSMEPQPGQMPQTPPMPQ